uniref:Uncharacterized protein n=1 Tax=Anguilla anguilla TaxID=7936 RepID=A0A0E9XR41_ANGAN
MAKKNTLPRLAGKTAIPQLFKVFFSLNSNIN